MLLAIVGVVITMPLTLKLSQVPKMSPNLMAYLCRLVHLSLLLDIKRLIIVKYVVGVVVIII